MTRADFTRKKCKLIGRMIEDGERPIEDYLKRSDEEQLRLFKEGKSKCDGVHKISQHQVGKAVDIYLLDTHGDLVDWKHIPKLAKKYHDLWVTMGGEPMIEWDQGHFEVK